MNFIKNNAKKYKHGIPLIIYMILYMTWFSWLEKNNTSHLRIIHTSFDDIIPFCEYFIVPYLLWFGYVAITVLYFFFKDKTEYKKLFLFLTIGMTLFLIISTFWPNGHRLRPLIMPRQNIFSSAVAILYSSDTPTNLWPSIHVFNSLACSIAILQSNHLSKNVIVKTGSTILTILIILSTMFLKQHSVFDVVTAMLLAVILFVFIYKPEYIQALLNNKPRHQIG